MMANLPRFVLASGALCLAAIVLAQPPRRDERPPNDRPRDMPAPADRMMRDDADGDGALTTSEVKDRRLHRVIEAADENADGKATHAELDQYFRHQAEAFGGDRRPRGGGDRERGNRDQPGERPRGDMPGPPPQPRELDGPPRPGLVIPGHMLRELNLTDIQRKEIAELQKHVDESLNRILTEAQREQLQRRPPRRDGRGDARGEGRRNGRGEGPPRGVGRDGDRPQDRGNRPLIEE